VRFGVHLAELCGIDLTNGTGAADRRRRLARHGPLGRGLDGGLRRRREPSLGGCRLVRDPWAPAFGLLGLARFFVQFEVTIASYEERVEPRPISA
jgi:hypothetical protein